MTSSDILSRLPYSAPFLFVDEILAVDETNITGTYTYHPSLDFYRGHFLDHPVTPGVILTETMAQIGLVCLGIYLSRIGKIDNDQIMLTSSAVDFLKPVYPGEKVTVHGEKVYFRFNKLKCNVRMLNAEGEVVCTGTLAGMLNRKSNG